MRTGTKSLIPNYKLWETKSYRYVWYAGTALGACSIISSFFVTDYTSYFVNQVSRKMTFDKTQHQDSTAEAGILAGASPAEKTD